MEVSETLVLEVDGHQFLYLSSEQWIWTCSVQILCTDGVLTIHILFQTKNELLGFSGMRNCKLNNGQITRSKEL